MRSMQRWTVRWVDTKYFNLDIAIVYFTSGYKLVIVISCMVGLSVTKLAPSLGSSDEQSG